MDVDPPTRPAGRTRGGFGGGTYRPGPQRTTSAGARAAPYTTTRPNSAPSAPATSGKWEHDLFGAGSNLYKPTLNLASLSNHLGQPVSSASLRPFGEATPPAQPLVTGGGPLPLLPSATSAQTPIFSRLGIRGVSNEAERERERERKRALEQQRRLDERRRREYEESTKQTRIIAEKEADGFVVQVEGLVWGTSAEDVQTAFGQYGDTSYCFIVNEATATESDDLIARLVFERKKDAEAACTKLNGAIADGKPLKVELVAPTPKPPPAPIPTGPRNEWPTGPKALVGPRAVIPPPAARTMYADEIEASDPRNANGSMDIDMGAVPVARPIPTAPAAHSQRGHGRGRGGAPAAPAQPASLLDRMGQTAGARSNGRGGGATGSRNAGASLLARLG